MHPIDHKLVRHIQERSTEAPRHLRDFRLVPPLTDIA
jgi:hypothetical protein